MTIITSSVSWVHQIYDEDPPEWSSESGSLALKKLNELDFDKIVFASCDNSFDINYSSKYEPSNFKLISDFFNCSLY